MSKFTVKELLGLIKLLRIDVFFLLANILVSLPSIAFNQLVQDKICTNKFSVNETVCLNLEKSEPGYDFIRNQVLKETTSLKLYLNILTTLPSIFISVILGHWLDTYPGHLRYLLASSVFSIICQNVFTIYQCFHFQLDSYSLIYTYLVPVLTGSGTIIQLGTYTYATRKTPAKYRALRFTVLEICLFASLPISSIFGGRILESKPWFPNQLRNYIGVYIVSSICGLIAAVWAIVMIYDSAESVNENVKSDEPGSDEVKNEKKKSLAQVVCDLINPNNYLDAARCIFKRKPNNAHWFLFSSIIAGYVSSMAYVGEQAISYQFAQRVYHFNAEKIGYYGSFPILFLAIGALLGPPLFIHWLKFHDSTVSAISYASMMFNFMIKGIVYDPIVYFLTIIGIFAGVSLVLDRVILSRMIEPTEIGRVYAVTGIIGGLVPTVSSLFYTKIFQATIDSNPGLVYLCSGLLFGYPVINSIILSIARNKWDLELIKKRKQTPTDKEMDKS
ncbi:proton-coupled folate transporter isoform X1 [Tetranychus urticae]|uniref:Major facilitator superfamily (MFS) profile domain-containing protein n=1 Tax=Tetranychus urticae TaxID=32264 RepID=T1KHP1_TETUR|nr:proton-coupled folate transporter isoform X1 [Tetranychus urticae]